MQIINWILLVGTSVMTLLFLTASIAEKEKRASFLAFFAVIGNGGLWFFFLYFGSQRPVFIINIVVVALMGILGLISLIKYVPATEKRDLSNALQFDERDHMFARNGLQRQPEHAKKYYAQNPEKEKIDTIIQQKIELGEPGHIYYDAYRTPIYEAAFQLLDRSRPLSEGEKAPEPREVDAVEMTKQIKEIGRIYGAVDVGITPLKPHHLYSHAGRRPENWGEKVNTSHRFAVVVVVAMDVERINGAPGLPAIIESSKQYVESAKIANIISHYIRYFGYDARSHTDGNYQTLCVPMAVDAGLGALGRMGIFMHPVYGPCVRISVVTTDLELIAEPANPPSTIHAIERFCDICKKCADNCPTLSISKDEEPSSRGFKHWGINQEKCFSFWKNIGTDCGFCIRVCPYTKPNTFIHKLVRFYISRNPINQRLALLMDDLFYGRKMPIPGITDGKEVP